MNTVNGRNNINASTSELFQQQKKNPNGLAVPMSFNCELDSIWDHQGGKLNEELSRADWNGSMSVGDCLSGLSTDIRTLSYLIMGGTAPGLEQRQRRKAAKSRQ